MIVGYARVSTEEQKLDLQISALTNAGCNIIYRDHGRSGHDFDRTGLDEALSSLMPGSTLVVWRLDRLGRSLSGLVELIEKLGKRHVHFRSVMENIDTSSPGGRLMFHLMAALAEFERALISERTRAGLQVAKAQGKPIGRPKALTEADICRALHEVHDAGATMVDTARWLGVSVRTLQRYLREARIVGENPPAADYRAAGAPTPPRMT
jgi:DNA invertase Pin-like site-specific DNA recombinase